MRPTRIAILGAESSGKTALTEDLALHYHSDAVFEYAREYMSSEIVTEEDLLHITKVQYDRENFVIQNSSTSYIFFDTEMINLKIWWEYAYGYIPELLSDLVLSNRYDYYLITANDLPWSADPLRTMPQIEDREKLKSTYIYEVKKTNIPYAIIEGRGEKRLHSAIDIIDTWGMKK